MTDSMRFLVFGAGAIGTYIGGSLALAGHQVVFIERPEIAQMLREHGMRLQIADQTREIPSPQVHGSLEQALEAESFDIGIFALKSFDTRSALKSMRPQWRSLPAILCLQNGVENESMLEEALGQERVIAGTVTSAVGRRSAGDILLERLRGVGIAHPHPIVPRLYQAMSQAGLNVRVYENAASMKWSKMLTNLVANATSAILEMTPEEIYSDPISAKIDKAQLRETLDVMDALGIKTVDLPGTPVRILTLGVRWVPDWLTKPLMKRAIGGGRGGKMPSLYIDLKNARGKSEVNYLNGAVVRFGEKCDVPTPVNLMLNETLSALTAGELPSGSFTHQPGKLMERLRQYS